jgi:hypothetical protein
MKNAKCKSKNEKWEAGNGKGFRRRREQTGKNARVKM